MKELLIESDKIKKLQEEDYKEYVLCESKYPLLSEIPDENRTDYFDVAYGPDPLNRLDIHHKKNKLNNPVVIFIHGGGWTKRDKDQSRFIAPALISKGFAVVAINYRLTDSHHQDPSKRNPHPAQINDCALALKWILDNIEKYGGDPNQNALLGHSAGAHLTSLLVSDTKWHQKYHIDFSRIKCWIGLSGIYDLLLEENYRHELMPEYIGGLIDEECKLADASPINFFKGTEPPCLLIHGKNDYLVPLTNSLILYDKLLEKDVISEIGIIKDAAHMNYFSNLSNEGQTASKIVIQFLRKSFT